MWNGLLSPYSEYRGKGGVLLLAFRLSYKCSMTFVGLLSSTAKIPGVLKAT